ncbi:MAG: SDR family NAD(P)-dependent oxidoreductase [Chryseolinea sp.]
MAKVLLTGSADGLGLLSARLLISEGHSVVLHARNEERSKKVRLQTPGAHAVLFGDLSSLEETINVAEQANALGKFDAVIHNAGVYQVSSKEIFAVNTIAPYVLTSLISAPARLVYMSSGMHMHGRPNFENFRREQVSYSDSKLHVLMLAKAVARRWHHTYANAVDPGWVPTRMGGPGAPEDLEKGYETQSWLAVSDDAKALVTGRYFKHQMERRYNTQADDASLQEQFLTKCREITGIPFPESNK